MGADCLQNLLSKVANIEKHSGSIINQSKEGSILGPGSRSWINNRKPKEIKKWWRLHRLRPDSEQDIKKIFQPDKKRFPLLLVLKRPSQSGIFVSIRLTWDSTNLSKYSIFCHKNKKQKKVSVVFNFKSRSLLAFVRSFLSKLRRKFLNRADLSFYLTWLISCERVEELGLSLLFWSFIQSQVTCSLINSINNFTSK